MFSKVNIEFIQVTEANLIHGYQHVRRWNSLTRDPLKRDEVPADQV